MHVIISHDHVHTVIHYLKSSFCSLQGSIKLRRGEKMQHFRSSLSQITTWSQYRSHKTKAGGWKLSWWDRSSQINRCCKHYFKCISLTKIMGWNANAGNKSSFFFRLILETCSNITVVTKSWMSSLSLQHLMLSLMLIFLFCFLEKPNLSQI